MKKGFAATPILFAAIFLIVGWLMIHYMDIDNFVASGIKKEGEIRKVQAMALKDVIINRTNSFLAGIYCAEISKSLSELENCIQTETGNRVIINNKNNGYQFEINYNIPVKEEFETSKVEKTFSVSETVDYPFQRLVDAETLIQANKPECDIKNGLNGKPFSDVRWDYIIESPCSCNLNQIGHWAISEEGLPYWVCDYEECTCSYSLYLNLNWIENNNISEIYPHIVNSYLNNYWSYTQPCGTGSCCC